MKTKAVNGGCLSKSLIRCVSLVIYDILRWIICWIIVCNPFLAIPLTGLPQISYQIKRKFYNGKRCKRLIGLAFLAAVGITLLVLGCALKSFNNWWPMFVLIFYLLVPIPTIISRRMSGSYDSASNACVELCIFLTTGIVVSCIALPIVLAHKGTIEPGACALVTSGSVVVFLTILGYFFVFGEDDMDYSQW